MKKFTYSLYKCNRRSNIYFLPYCDVYLSKKENKSKVVQSISCSLDGG